MILLFTLSQQAPDSVPGFCLPLDMLVTLNGLAPLHCRPLQNATISKMKSDNFKAKQKGLQAIAL
jgi:hypothetical protein